MQIFRITSGKLKPGTWDKFEAAIRKAIDELGPVPGLVSRSLARDVNDGDRGYAISIWENIEALNAYEQSGLRTKVNPLLQEFFTGEYTCNHCEVRYWDMMA